MFKVVTVAQMREIEAAADASGTSYDEMMQRAGRAAADRAQALISHLPEPRIALLIGPGNNGGDGMVCGLHLAQDNDQAQVRFYCLKERADDFTEIAREAGLFIAKAEDDHDGRVLRNMVASSDLVIDALFGIGVRLPIREEGAKVLRFANQAINARRRERPDNPVILPTHPQSDPKPPQLTVLAIDCPSGLDSDTGALDKNVIPADETITFIAAKKGQLTFPGAASVGRLSLAGLDVTIARHQATEGALITGEAVRELLPPRPLDSNKGTFGKALIAGGSVNYVGAVGLSAMAAYRSGAGLVSVAAPMPVVAALAGSHLEVTWFMLAHDMGVIAEKAAETLLKEAGAYDALLIGPGMGREKTSGDFLRAVLTQPREDQPKPRKKALGFGRVHDHDETTSADDQAVRVPPLVLDADALNLLSEMDDWPALLPENTILTPHPGEMGRLCGLATSEIVANRWQIIREKAAAWQAVILLKGAHTLIAAPDGRLAALPFKTDALATAGTGDVLAGIIAGLLAQGMKPYEAALVGGYLHGLAATDGPGRALIASDLFESLEKPL